MTKILIALAAGLSLALFTGCQSTDDAMHGSEAASAERMAGPVNEQCPINNNHSVDPDVTTEWNGHVVGFCCGGCVDDWNAMDDDGKRAALVAAGVEFD